MFDLTSVGGFSILSSFCHECAPQSNSQFVSSYDSSLNVLLESNVEYFRCEQLLRISQKSELWSGSIVEEMKLFREVELIDLMESCGFQNVKSVADFSDLKKVALLQRKNNFKTTIIGFRN
jgi:hypothetical protein